jgi:parallel beta-helix repeat protein
MHINSGFTDKYMYANTFFGNNYGLYAVGSSDDELFWNRFENNGVGLYVDQVKNMDVIDNGFMDNTQDCQFGETKKLSFDANYWDNWVGHRFKINLGFPKIINGYHDADQSLMSQIKIDRHPSKTFNQNADYL